MLRKIRIVAATICFTLITLLFLDFTGTLHPWFGWLAKIQFLPAVLALEPRRRRCSSLSSTWIVRTGLLLGNLPARCIPGCRFVAGGETEERTDSGIPPPCLMAAIRRDGALFILALLSRVHGLWAALDRTLQRIRAVSPPTLFAPLWQWGNNFTRLLGRAWRAVMRSTPPTSG